MNIGFRSAIGQMGHTVSAELISRSWKEARPDYTLITEVAELGSRPRTATTPR
jgi:hypothetical protein